MAKGKGGNTVAVVERIARPVVEALGYRLWDVRYEKEGPDHFLRVFIDKDGDMGVSYTHLGRSGRTFLLPGHVDELSLLRQKERV